MNSNIEVLKNLLLVPDLADKKWVSEQYDSQVMNDTIAINGDASVVRVRGTKKALAISVDCTPRYVEADSYEGAIQAVCETYRNISAVGAKPLAITNCLNFGNPQKPEIMGQIVRSIQGITEACKFLDYPVVSGNVSLYNETDGKAIQPTPAIGGVGLLSDYQKRCDIKFKNIDDKIFVIAGSFGDISCSIYQRDILKINQQKNPPKVNLELEKKHSEIVRELIQKGVLASCHDISDGGLLVACFEKSTINLGCNININEIKKDYPDCLESEILFGEDQSRYVVSVNNYNLKDFVKILDKNQIKFYQIGEVIKENLVINDQIISISELQKISQSVFEKNFL